MCFLVVLAHYNKYTICLISFSKLSDLLPAFPCASVVGNVWSIYLTINILILFLWADFNRNITLLIELSATSAPL